MSQTLRIISIRSLKFITSGILFINQYYTKENTYVRLADRAMASICVFFLLRFLVWFLPGVYIALRCICPPRVCCLRIHLGEENCPDLSSSKNKYGRHRAKYPLSCLTSIEHVNFIFVRTAWRSCPLSSFDLPLVLAELCGMPWQELYFTCANKFYNFTFYINVHT